MMKSGTNQGIRFMTYEEIKAYLRVFEDIFNFIILNKLQIFKKNTDFIPETVIRIISGALAGIIKF